MGRSQAQSGTGRPWGNCRVDSLTVRQSGTVWDGLAMGELHRGQFDSLTVRQSDSKTI